MVCFLVSSVPKPTRSEDVLPSPSKLGLKRGRNSAVPLSPAAGLATSRQGLGDKDQLMPLSSLATRRDPQFSQRQSAEDKKVPGCLVRNGSQGCLSAAENLRGKTSKKKKKKCIATSPILLKEGKVSSTACAFSEETMSGYVKEIRKVIDAKRCVKDTINDFDIHCIATWTKVEVKRNLDKVWRKFVKFCSNSSSQCWNFIEDNFRFCVSIMRNKDMLKERGRCHMRNYINISK